MSKTIVRISTISTSSSDDTSSTQTQTGSSSSIRKSYTIEDICSSAGRLTQLPQSNANDTPPASTFQKCRSFVQVNCIRRICAPDASDFVIGVSCVRWTFLFVFTLELTAKTNCVKCHFCFLSILFLAPSVIFVYLLLFFNVACNLRFFPCVAPFECNRCALAIIALSSYWHYIDCRIVCVCVCRCWSMEMNSLAKQLTAISDKSHSALVANDYHGNGNGNHTSRTASSARTSSTVRVSIEQDQHFFMQRIVKHCKVVDTIPNNFFLKLYSLCNSCLFVVCFVRILLSLSISHTDILDFCSKIIYFFVFNGSVNIWKYTIS